MSAHNDLEVHVHVKVEPLSSADDVERESDEDAKEQSVAGDGILKKEVSFLKLSVGSRIIAKLYYPASSVQPDIVTYM